MMAWTDTIEANDQTPEPEVEVPQFLSIVMPAYNSERYIEDAVQSILNQTYRDYELIVINDGSSDRTGEILERLSQEDERIRLVHQENMGVAPTLNNGIDLARSNWIVRMDSDDLMEPNRLERQIAFLEENPDLAVASCLVTYINHLGSVTGVSSPELSTDDDVARWREKNVLLGFHHPGVIMRKDVVNAIGRYRDETWPAEDLDLWNRIADAGHRILVQPEYLIRYRVHEQSITVRESRKGRLYVHWLIDSTLRRRQGLPERTFEEFRESMRAWPWYRRLNFARKEQAQIFYKHGAFLYSNGSPIRAALWAGIASVLDPKDIPARILEKYVRPAWFKMGEHRRVVRGDVE
jgi:glycosyltransferase involved in cell wall biosynthesis